MEATQYSSTYEWIKKLWHILLSHKKDQMWVSSSEMDEPRALIQGEVSQKEKNIYHILTHIYEI